MIKSKKQMFIVIGVFTLVMMLGTITYAFFNYTRTGTANVIKTGRIYFNTTQSNTLNLTNVFPMSAADAGNANLDAVDIRIQGDTTYANGEEFEITITGVNNTINNKIVPINYIATYTATPVQSGDSNVIGTSSNDYFTNRGSTTAIYSLKSTGVASDGEQVLVGYIPKDIAIDGTLTIKAYLDIDNVVISDTYPAEETDTNSDGYIDGTPTSFGNNKTVLTTTEWNSLQNTQTPLSFKIKAVSNEGIWVENPNLAWKVISNVEGLNNVADAKRYVGAEADNYVIFNDEQWRIIGVYNDKVKIIRANPLSSTMQYNSNSDNDSNVWNNSSLKEYLNVDYYNSLSSTAKSMIEVGTWNVGSCGAKINAASSYSCSQTVTWSGKIGLLASYEYQYASESSCYDTNGYSYYYSDGNGCAAKDWLRIEGSGMRWLITPDITGNNRSVLTLNNPYGYVNYDNLVIQSYYIQPVVYLNSNVVITGGTGESGGNEYTLSYTAS